MEVAMLCAFCSCGSNSETHSPENTTSAPPPRGTGENEGGGSQQIGQRGAGGGLRNSSNNYAPTNNGAQATGVSPKQKKTTSASAKSSGASSHWHQGSQLAATKDDLEQWKSSFDILMSTTRGQDHFRQFLRSEYSEENMLFWLSCEDLKALKDNSQISAKCKQIYEEYISVLSPKEVSIDSRIREVINRKMMNPDTKTFEEAQNQIYQLMRRDSYHRFINSPFFKSLENSAVATTATTANTGGGGGSGGSSSSNKSSSQVSSSTSSAAQKSLQTTTVNNNSNKSSCSQSQQQPTTSLSKIDKTIATNSNETTTSASAVATTHSNPKKGQSD